MKLIITSLSFLALAIGAMAQKVAFTEYDLKNGLHVVLHQDKSVPVVAVSVMYHVGSKDEQTNRTGFAHFFEHLLFEGSDNIKRGEFMKLVSSNGGQNNANTTQDRTFYYEVFPSNQLATGIWLESERMMHPARHIFEIVGSGSFQPYSFDAASITAKPCARPVASRQYSGC